LAEDEGYEDVGGVLICYGQIPKLFELGAANEMLAELYGIQTSEVDEMIQQHHNGEGSIRAGI
jgi:hypothetical protein